MKMTKEEVRQTLIDGTIHIIATKGFDGATTKQIGTYTGINEAYIYRNFVDKEDMFVASFNVLDQELVNALLHAMPVMDDESLDPYERSFLFFSAMWKFFLDKQERSICFMRYYYSYYFFKYSVDEHKRAYHKVIEEMAPAFKEGTDVWMMLNHMLDIFLAWVVKTVNGVCENNDKTVSTIFGLIYDSVEKHLAWT